jgi:ribosome-binding ATPase YchF (GTP1/OBG family)
LQKEDLTTLETIFDVMISSTRSKYEDVQLKKLYDDYMADQQKNKFISNVPHALDLLKHTVFSSDKFNEVKIWSFMDNSKFIVMMKRVLSDFCLNCERVISVDIDDERTFAAETVVVIFKSLGILCDLSFRW